MTMLVRGGATGGGGGTAPNATPAAPGLVQLAGDLAGTAAAPTVPALATKANSSSLSPVATSGSYGDLTGRPSVPTVLAAGKKTATTSSGSSYVVDPDLLLSGVQPGTYQVTAVLWNSATTGLWVVLGGTAALSYRWQVTSSSANAGATGPLNPGVGPNLSTLVGSLIVSTAGTVGVQWQPGTQGTNSTLDVGSSLTLTKVA